MGVSTRTAAQRTKMSRADSRMGTTCATIITVGVRVPDGKRAHARAARQINRRDCVPQQLVGRPVSERQTTVRPPLNVAGQSLDQMVGREHLALLIENQRREADNRQRFAGDMRPFELQARR